MMPLWQESQRPAMALWFMFTFAQLVVLRWQLSQTLVEPPWLGVLPLAVVPLWQEKQLLLIPLWLNVAGSQALVEWQSLHCAVVAICVPGLPVAAVPLWQLEQVPVTCE